MKRIALLTTALVAAGILQTATAQAPNQALAASIVAARQKNATLMKQYSWNCRIELIENGQVSDTRIDLVNFGPDGNPQYTLLNDQGSPLPQGFLRRRLAEKERERTENHIKEVRTLLNQYTLPASVSVGTFLATATIQAPDANGLLQITGGSVVKPGDTLSIWASAPGGQISRVKAMTFYDGDEVNLTASYKTLASGLSYMAYATVTIPAKNLTVQVQNFDYINQNN
jgi:hypothetical protein